MSKSKPRRPLPSDYHLTMEIDDYLTHYALGERFPRDRPGPLLSEMLLLTLWGTIVSPKEKVGRDIQATISASDELAHPMRSAPSDAEPPVIGELGWGADRVARLYVPPTTIWPLTNAIAAGHITRVGIKIDGPPRGTMPIRGMNALTREVSIRIGKRVFRPAANSADDDAAEAERVGRLIEEKMAEHD